MPHRFAAIAVVLVLTFGSGEPSAQSLGTFRWQLQPFCNVVTVTVIQQGAVFTVNGYDDQCGAPQRATLVGLATPNPDGTIGLGLHVVTVPGGRGLHIDARISLATLSGPWADSAGNSGTFAFGASAGGSPRPPPTVPGAAIAPGTIGATQIIAAQVQSRVGGTCANGQALRGVNLDGSVVCTNALTTVEDIANRVGWHPSVAIGTDGLAVISHMDETAGTVRVTHCGNAACTAGNTTTTVDDPVSFVGYDTSLAIGVDGFPVISYSDTTIGALRVTHCGNVACTAGNTSTTVDDTPNAVGYFSSLAIGADGLPVISHRDNTAGTLRVTHCGNPACTAGNTSVVVDDPANSVGRYSAIAIGSDGLPVISHGDVTAGALRVTHCGNAACTNSNTTTTVDDPVNVVGEYTAIAIGADGRPVISHHDATARTLRVTYCGNAACTAANVSTTVDDPQNLVGFDTSIAIGADGLPVISHRDSTAGALRVTHCGNASCSAGNVSTAVDDPTNFVGYSTTIAIGVDGLPVIAHLDGDAHALLVAKCGTRSCQ